MALSARERALIDAIVESQLRLEQIVASQISPAAGLGVRLMRADPLDSPFVISAEEHRRTSRRAASAGKRAGIKTRRKVSGYQKEFGKQLKKLKKKHPRTNISTLMKRAHKATRKVRK